MPRPYFTNYQQQVHQIIRVNHAGEFGAQRIYQGQIAYIKQPEHQSIIQHMLDQETEHLDFFSAQILEHKVRPTIFLPIWSVYGYVLGAISAMVSSKTAMLVTHAVEEVIVDHYQRQIDYLSTTNADQNLLTMIQKFKQDEAEHIDIAIENNSKGAVLHNMCKRLVQLFCKGAIAISEIL